MSILQTIFGNSKPATPAPEGAANKEAIANNKPPEGTPAPNSSAEPKSPLDGFAHLWEPVKEAAPGTEPVNFNADPAKLMEAASKIDFTKIIKPEQLAAIQGGGEEATKALVNVLQAMQTQTYAQSTFAATKIAETTAAQVTENFQKQLPALLKKHGLENKLLEENPALSHPSIQPIVQAMQTQFAAKFPNATPAELLKMSQEYVAGLGQVFAPPSAPTKSAKAKAAETDWSKFLPESPFQ